MPLQCPIKNKSKKKDCLLFGGNLQQGLLIPLQHSSLPTPHCINLRTNFSKCDAIHPFDLLNKTVKHSLWYIMKRELYSNWSFVLLQHNVKEVGGGEEPVGQPPLKGLASCPLSDQQCNLGRAESLSLETWATPWATWLHNYLGLLPPVGPAVQLVGSRELETARRLQPGW